MILHTAGVVAEERQVEPERVRDDDSSPFGTESPMTSLASAIGLKARAGRASSADTRTAEFGPKSHRRNARLAQRVVELPHALVGDRVERLL